MTTFALDPRQTRTGFNAMSANMQRLGDSIIHNGSVGKHSFLATPMIDNTPAETGGVGLHFEFRQRDKSKEIQKKAFSHFSPSRIQTFDQIHPRRRIPYEKISKMERRYERNRKEMANSILSSSSNKLQNVMKTLPLDKLSPPF